MQPDQVTEGAYRVITHSLGHKRTLEQTSIGRKYGGSVKIIASIEDPALIRKILVHLADKVTSGVGTMVSPDLGQEFSRKQSLK